MDKLIRNIYMYVLAAIIIIGFFILLYMLLGSEIPAGNTEILNIVIGALITCFTSVVAYFFGSSKGSADKTDILVNNGKPKE